MMIKINKHTKIYSLLIIVVLTLCTALFLQFQANKGLKAQIKTHRSQAQYTLEVLTKEEQANTEAQTQISVLTSEKSALENQIETLDVQMSALQGIQAKLAIAEKIQKNLKNQLNVSQAAHKNCMEDQQNKLSQCLQSAAKNQYEIHALNQRIQQLETEKN